MRLSCLRDVDGVRPDCVFRVVLRVSRTNKNSRALGGARLVSLGDEIDDQMTFVWPGTATAGVRGMASQSYFSGARLISEASASSIESIWPE